ncbi:response regulator [Echinicola sediminis]
MSKISFKKLLIAGFSLSLVIVAFVNYSSYRGLKSFQERVAWVNHTYDVLLASKETLIQLLNAEASQNGYLLTQDENYLELYHVTTDSVHVLLDRLQNLVSDNPGQTKKVKKLEKVVLKKLDNLEATIFGEMPSIQEESSGLDISEGQDLIAEVRNMVSDIIAEENNLLAERETLAQSNADRAMLNILLGVSAVLVIIFLLFGYIIRTFGEKTKAEEVVKNANKELEKLSAEREEKNWLLKGEKLLNEKLHGDQTMDQLSENVLHFFAEYLNAKIGAIHLFLPEKKKLKLLNSYACTLPSHSKETGLGDGLLGQVARDLTTVVIKDVPKDYYKIKTSLGEMSPDFILITPIIYNSKLKGVIELGFSGKPKSREKRLIEQINSTISVAIHTTQGHDNMRELYEKLQVQAEELESQQEELRQTNEELSHQTEMLQASEEELRVQQEHLQRSNVDLEEKAALLEEKNQEVEEARASLIKKAEELEQTNRYKSEFLANMSHELRTPLNSVLILAKLLSDNKNDNLNEEEIKFAKVIHKAGSDLLTLINDILDLSKVESGNLDIYEDAIELYDIVENMRYLFKEVAADKNITFITEIGERLPRSISSDRQRIDQIIRNLLSNAFKFTPSGGEVKLDFKLVQGSRIAITVKDSGIGISQEKQQLIFEAFKQADGTTSRKYGGTGLGLSISKELSKLLKGSISLQSEEGKGSAFTLELPLHLGLEDTEAASPSHPVEAATPPRSVNDEKQDKTPAISLKNNHEPKRLLIVEDDENFADILATYAKKKGFDSTVALNGEQALQVMKAMVPAAVLLDIMLPGIDGWEVLKWMKEQPHLKNVPVHIMSATDRNPKKLSESGATTFINKPVDQAILDNVFDQLKPSLPNSTKTVLIIEDQEIQSNVLKTKLQEEGYEIIQAFTGNEGIAKAEAMRFDSIILDLNLPDIPGEDVLDSIKSTEKNAETPVIINTAMMLPEALSTRILNYSNAVVVKTPKSNERILDEVKLFMRKIHTSSTSQSPLSSASSPSSKRLKSLEGKKLLLVDDDMRNIFALSSSLQQHGLKVEIANNGLEALDKLQQTEGIDLVLMDIMMPEMDGYEAMKNIRSGNTYKEVPIIALTAKAMKNDREKCIEAGANDYISKPVDMDKLLSLMRVWLSN